MKTVTHLKKIKNHIEVTFDDQDIIYVEPELSIKFHLSLGQLVELEDFQKLINENSLLSCKREALRALKKMMTILEMKNFLLSKGYQLHVVNQVVSDLIQKRYLDDATYAKMYVNVKKQKEGPQMISHKLAEKGIKEGLIASAISTYQEFDIITEIIQLKLSHIKNKTKRQAFQSIKTQLMAKGFHREMIDRALAQAHDFYHADEKALLIKNYEKLFKTYHLKYQGYELERRIKEKLYQKGFSYDLIQSFIEGKKLHS